MASIDPIREVPEPATVPRSRGLGALFENSLIRFVVQVFNRAKEGIADLFRYAFESTLEHLEKPLLRYAAPALDSILASPDVPDDIRAVLVAARAGEDQVGVATALGAAVVIATALFPAAIAGLSGKLRNASFQMFRPGLLGPDVLQKAYHLDPKWYNLKQRNLYEQGLSDDQIALLDDVLAVRPDVRDLLTLWNRGDLTDAQLNDRLHRLGVTAESIPEYQKLAKGIPGPADLVRFALREAWRDDVVSRWGYDQAFVPEFAEAMKQQGYDPEWARLYWRSHWMVPSAGQGFEMMYRGVISEEELRDLLKVNDLAPGWIEHMMRIARPIPGRIDRRYAYREGEIGAEELFNLYKSDGYDDTWAEILTNTTIKMAISETKGLTRASIEKAYRLRRITEAEALSMMSDLGIQREIAAFYLEQADNDRADELLDLRIDAVEKRFKNQVITESETRDQLAALGVGGDEVQARLDVWMTAIRIAVRRPSKADLGNWFREGTISIDGYRDRMLLLDYPAADVDLYLSSLALERQEIAEDVERKAREEQERIRTSRIKSDYQVRKAEIDKDIAEVNSAVAGAQVALVEAQAERDRRLGQAVSVADADALEAEYRPLLLEASAAIDAAQLEIAEIQTSISGVQIESQQVDQSLAANADIVTRTALQSERLGIDTELSRLGYQIAGQKTEMARLEAELAITPDVERITEIVSILPEIQVTIAELEETQAERKIRIEEIDEGLLVTLSAEARADLEGDREALNLRVRELQAEIAELRETIRQVQLERNGLQAELDAELAALPGRADQVAIRLEYGQKIAEIERKIRLLRANVADLRIARADLAVEYRSAVV